MKNISAVITVALLAAASVAYGQGAAFKEQGRCGEDVQWTFDGVTLTLQNVSKNGLVAEMADYGRNRNTAPWNKPGFEVKKVRVGAKISRIGSFAFANCTQLREVVFEGTSLTQIGSGAFLNCKQLRTISLPPVLRQIGTVAFANCESLPMMVIPDKCYVGDMAFASCKGIQYLDMGATTMLGNRVFISEEKVDGKTVQKMYDREIRNIPAYITVNNCAEYGLSKGSVERHQSGRKGKAEQDYDVATSEVDTYIPVSDLVFDDTYALIIGNQNYRFAGEVPYAIHDARVFAEYCKKTLGIPEGNINLVEDATKAMIMEEGVEDWVSQIPDRKKKKLILYYAGHGVPDVRDGGKAYLLPVDVRGTNARRGIALDEFYATLGVLDFGQTTVVLDACFSGVNRNDEGVVEGMRGVAIRPRDEVLGAGSVVVFSASQGNETAQGYAQEGHGLFTYCLLKELQESSGTISYGRLADRLKEEVGSRSKQMPQHKSQTPATNVSEALSSSWRELTF